MQNMSAILTVMMSAKKKAARKLIRDYNEIQYLRSSKKPLEQFVKMAYMRAEQSVQEELLVVRPNFSILSKILGHKVGTDSKNRWLINCVTSQENFAYGLPFFGISIAHECDGVIVASVLDLMAMGETYYASKGEGAWVERNTQLANDTLRLRVCASNGANNAMVFTDNSEIGKLVGNGRVLGCPATGLAYTAAGKADACVFNNVHLCDVAAGMLLVREAGGKVSDYQADANNVIAKIWAGELAI